MEHVSVAGDQDTRAVSPVPAPRPAPAPPGLPPPVAGPRPGVRWAEAGGTAALQPQTRPITESLHLRHYQDTMLNRP